MREIELNNMTRTDVCLWLDFYGELLTRHTRDVLELYYGEDMSMPEIAASLGITRQAVHDRIRQGVGHLAGFENKLNLVSRFRLQKEYVGQALAALEAGEQDKARDQLMQLNCLL
jgi:uncharacterized protein